MGQILFWVYFLQIFSAILLAKKVNGDTNVNETVKATVLVSDTHNVNESLPMKTNQTQIENKTMEMHRITQPIAESHSSTHQIGRTLFPVLPSNTSADKKFQNGNFKPKPADFRPSPQLDTYYEYNRFPVIPAHPEPKHFGGINLNEKPIRSDVPWLDTRPINNFPSTTQQPPWYNKINFPTTQNPFLTVRDHPYPYLLTGNYPETTTKSQYPYFITGTNSIDTTTRVQYPYVITGTNFETTTRNPGYGSPTGFSKFGGFDHGSLQNIFSSKFGGFGGGKPGLSSGSTGNNGNPFLQKTHFELPHSVSPHSASPHALSPSGGGSSAVSPWKKIIKFLTAFIPIGLLISALTPTVINVSPMNMTQSRGRAEGTDRISAEKLLTSLNYINKLNAAGCEERVVCELLMGASSSSNAEHHLENLLHAFTEEEHDGVDQVGELRKIFEAVKSGDCTSLVCDSIQKNTDSDSSGNNKDDEV